MLEKPERTEVFHERYGADMSLADAKVGEEYFVKDIIAEDEELRSFLFSLGCYSGEPITVISHIRGGCVVSVKEARYNMDRSLAQAIMIAGNRSLSMIDG